MHVRILLLVSSLLTSIGLFAQINIWEGELMMNPDRSEVKYFILDQVSVTDSTLYELLPGQWKPLSGKIELKNKAQTIWVKIPCKNISSSVKWLFVNDRHINQIKIWIVRGNKIIRSFPITGDHFNFYSRPIPTVDFAFPVDLNEIKDCEIVVASDKRHVKNILPIHFLSDQDYFKMTERKTILQGVLLGLVIIMLFYNFSLFFTTRLSLYIWYGIYLTSILIYFFAEMGYFFQYVIPGHPEWNDVFPVGIIASSFIPFIVFINQMLELKKNQRLFYKINNVFLIGFSLILISGIVASMSGDFEIQEFWLRIYRIISPAFLLILFVESLICLKHKIAFSAYAVFSIASLILMSVVYLLHDNGNIPTNMISSNSFIIGISIEICIMTLAISARFKSYKNETEQLLITQEKEKEKIIKSISAFKEQEMLRFSNMLHDSVGAQLSAIRLNIEAINNRNKEALNDADIAAITKDIGNLADEVRVFSHQLSPVLLEKKGLLETVGNLINTINRARTLHIQFEPMGSLKNIPFHYELLIYNIIQELLQNIIRHAEATEVIVQLILEKTLVSLYVEDNGKGFDKEIVSEGLGLTQIKKLTGFVNGTFQINAQKDNGTIISIEFNLKLNEEKA